MLNSRSRVLPLTICFLLFIAMLSSFSTIHADTRWSLSADVQPFSLKHTEYYQNATRNSEKGSITMSSLNLGYSIDRLSLAAYYSFGSSQTVDYDGLSIQSERPLTGKSNYDIDQLGGSIAYHIDLTDTMIIAPYVGVSVTGTRREILAGNGLSEKYRWVELEAGFDGRWSLNDSSQLGVKAALLSMNNGRLTADLISAGYSSNADISLGSGNGYLFSLYYERQVANGLRFRFGPTIKKWTLPESRGNIIFSNTDPNTPLIAISPESDTSYRGFDLKIDYSF